MPKEDTILSIQKYKHPHMDRHYLEAQKALRAMQNTSGLHLGGILAGLGDSHEDAITVALQTAKLLSEKYQCLNENTRLKPLLDNQQRVSTKNIQLGERLAQAKREHTEKAPVCC